jgi:hypothetical protein
MKIKKYLIIFVIYCLYITNLDVNGIRIGLTKNYLNNNNSEKSNNNGHSNSLFSVTYKSKAKSNMFSTGTYNNKQMFYTTVSTNNYQSQPRDAVKRNTQSNFHTIRPDSPVDQVETSQKFKEKSSNVFIAPDGAKYDLSYLKNDKADYQFDTLNSSYRANFARDLVSPCGTSITPAAIFTKNGMCTGNLTSSWSNLSVSYINESSKNDGIKIDFASKGGNCMYSMNGMNSLKYKIKCDMNAANTSIESVKVMNSCTYEYTFVSQHACYVLPSSGIFYYPSFNILVFLIVGFIAYVFLFGYVNFKNNPEDGIFKAFPHTDFWNEFVQLVVCGGNSVVRRIKEKM